MAWGVYNIDLHSLVEYRDVFAQDSNATLPFKVVVVQNQAALTALLRPLHVGLGYHPIHQRCLAVVYVRNDGNVANLHVATQISGRKGRNILGNKARATDCTLHFCANPRERMRHALWRLV